LWFSPLFFFTPICGVYRQDTFVSKLSPFFYICAMLIRDAPSASRSLIPSLQNPETLTFRFLLERCVKMRVTCKPFFPPIVSRTLHTLFHPEFCLGSPKEWTLIGPQPVLKRKCFWSFSPFTFFPLPSSFPPYFFRVTVLSLPMLLFALFPPPKFFLVSRKASPFFPQCVANSPFVIFPCFKKSLVFVVLESISRLFFFLPEFERPHFCIF